MVARRVVSAPGLCLLASLVLGLGTPARADLLVPKSGPKISGVLVSQDERGIVFNPYWSTNPAMTFEVVRLAPEQVKKLEVEPRPEPEFFRRLRARTPGDAPSLLALAAWAKERKLKPHAEMALAFAVAESPGSTEALAALGGRPRFEALARGNPLLDAEWRALLQRYAGEATAEGRRDLATQLAARGPTLRPETLGRYRRSATEPKGLVEDLPLSLHADRYVGAVYTLFVPEAYEPSISWPLLIGLHGGGPDGKDRDEVVGSGPSAMNFYRTLAAEHGVLVACPTAQMAGWGNKVNEDLVRDVIAEVGLRYHVDLDRIHLTGHSMGGYGTWSLGPRMANLFATISPMAGAGDGNVKALVESRTPIFIYHSADDFISVEPDRQAARALRASDLDFVYTELDKEGHGCPDSVRAELFAFLLPRRNFDPASKDAWPRSSFAGKVTPDEKTYLGDPTEVLEEPSPTLDAQLAAVRLGGGRARAAATALAQARPEGVAEGLAKVLKDEKLAPHARAEAARALGLLGEAAGTSALHRVLSGPARRETSVLAAACATALAKAGSAKDADAYAAATKAWAAYFESKRTGETMRFSDWERSLHTLAAIVAGWADLGGAGSADLLDKALVARVFLAPPKVETSDRVPQDPSLARTALARAIARAYAAAGAPAPRWEALLASLASDATAKAAAEEERK